MGLTTLDVIHRVGQAPARNQKVTALRQDVSAGGPAANAAVTVAVLSSPGDAACGVVLITALGEGPVAAAARADLDARGVTVLDCVPDSGEFDLAVSAVMVDDATGERSVTSPDAGAVTVAGPSHAELDAWAQRYGVPQAILLDGHHPEIARAVLAWALTLDVPPSIVLDAGRWRPVFADLIPHADVVAMSADFAIPRSQNTVQSALKMGAKAVVVTHGGDAVEWWVAEADEIPAGYDNAESGMAETGMSESGTAATTLAETGMAGSGKPTAGTIAVTQVPVQDTLGAGDAFHGALVVALAEQARQLAKSHEDNTPEADQHRADQHRADQHHPDPH
ncbi:MAG: PfkB family carbohydrate kinase, partial [Cellulomonadaceae bacterium]|nr:PfkB family carbohydrate kinase [Cellulomonadaceae bacterium]